MALAMLSKDEGDTYKSSSKNQVLGLRDATIFGAHIPLASGGVEIRANNNSVEGAVLLDADYLVDMVEIISQICVRGIVAWPIPRVPNLGPRKLILGDLRVNTGAGVAVPTPGASSVISCLEDHSLITAVSEGFEHEDTS